MQTPNAIGEHISHAQPTGVFQAMRHPHQWCMGQKILAIYRMFNSQEFL